MNRKALVWVVTGLLLIATSCTSATTSLLSTPESGRAIQTPAPVTPAALVYPLSEPGSYQFGTRTGYKFSDPGRENAEVSMYVWYPAITDAASATSTHHYDAPPDPSAAPYPLLLTSLRSGMVFGEHLATYGFVVVGVQVPASPRAWGTWLVDYPRALVFVLEQLANTPLAGLEGMLDPDNAGTLGYSFDGYNALALSGARIDPAYYSQQCAGARSLNPPPEDWWIDYICGMAAEWDQFAASAGTAITNTADGLWQPVTDARLKAFLPMAPEGAWLFGERGLAVVERPILVIGAELDDINPYALEAAAIYRQLGADEKSLITFLGQGHNMVEDSAAQPALQHFAAAFFGYHLQGKSDYAAFFSEEFVRQRLELAWGELPGK